MSRINENDKMRLFGKRIGCSRNTPNSLLERCSMRLAFASVVAFRGTTSTNGHHLSVKYSLTFSSRIDNTFPTK